jgi:Holliday junction resolvase RusA-like endonuclease
MSDTHYLDALGVASKFVAPDVSAQPFRPEPAIVLDLPCPPSVNRIWQHNKRGSKRVSRSPEYTTWLGQADRHSILTKQLRGVKMIRGRFEIEIIIARTAGDLDNRIKGVLDWCQSRHVIENDKHCEKITVEWGEAPRGCKVILRACA